MFKYNPKRITCSLMSIKGEAYMDGTFIEIEYEEDAVTTHNGSQGEMTAVLNPNKHAKATLTFVQGSPTNDAFSKKVPDASKDFFPNGPFLMKDLNGTTVVKSQNAFIQKMSKIEFGKNVTGRQWIIILPDAEITAGGDGS